MRSSVAYKTSKIFLGLLKVTNTVIKECFNRTFFMHSLCNIMGLIHQIFNSGVNTQIMQSVQ